MSQNINGLPAHRSHYKSQQIMKTICTGSADLWMIQEVGLCWPLINEADQWNVRTRIKGARIHSSLGYNKKEIEISEPLQAGGVGVIATNIMTPRCTSKGTDPSGLGRWAWTRIEGTTGFHSRIVSVYRPCTPSQQGAGTVYEQHRRTFPADTDPREAILDDLKVEIVQWQEEGDVIVLGMDANEDTRSKTISDFFEELNMKNAILTRHSHLSPPATHTRNKNREPIDGIWVSKGIDPIGAGFLACGDACPSDHVALWVDFNQSDLLGEKLESFAVSINRMKSDDPRLVTKYNQLSKKALRNDKILPRLAALHKVPLHQWSSSHTAEYNTIHRINTQVRKDIGANIRKVFMGNIPWSPKLGVLYDRIELMKLVVKKRQGVRTSMTKIRRLMRKTGAWNAIQVDLDGANRLLGEAFTTYKASRELAPKWRESHVDELDKAKAIKNKTTQIKESKQRKSIERQRKLSRVVKKLRHKTKNAVTKLFFTTEDNERIECTTKYSMETACILENERRFSQTEDTPPMSAELLDRIGEVAEEEGAEQILAGTFIPPLGCDPYMQDLIEEMRMDNRARQAGTLPTSISQDEHTYGWRKQKERTASVSSGLSFSDHKAAIDDPEMSEIDRLLREIPYSRGFSPELYQIITDFEILKKSGVYDVEKMRTIQLFVAQFNMNNKKSGRDVMKRAEALGLMPKEQAGSRKHHRSVLSALNKVLTMDLLRMRRQAGALCSNDAKSCYDRIVHWVAALCMRRMGLSKEATLEMFLSLKAAWHHIATAYGESSRRYGGNRWPRPLQGVGQGNGAGPMIWAVISAVLIAIMRKHGHGISILTPLSLTVLYVVCFAFVDDTDVAHGGQNTDTTGEEVLPEMQEVVNRWEGSVRATGGALVPSKSYWYLIDFEWIKGKWRYRSKSNMPGEITIKGVDGVRVQLERLEPSEARETLGVFIAMDGNWREQVKALKEKSVAFAEQLRYGATKPNEAWYAFNSTIMKSLEYPMEATCIGEKDWEEIMKPMVGIVLQKSGIAKTFPRDVFYSSVNYQGLAVKQPWFRQQIVHLLTLCKETTSGTPTGELLTATAEQLRLELGIPGGFTHTRFSLLEPYVTHSWLKDLILFLHKFDILLLDPLPKLTKQRAGDLFLMEYFLEQGFRGDELSNLNACRQVLRVTTLADISTLTGTHLHQWAWLGQFQPEVTDKGWPRRPSLKKSNWTQWQIALMPLLQTHLRLRRALGEWLEAPPLDWKWFYSPSEERLYSKHGCVWKSLRRQGRASLRTGDEFIPISSVCLEIPDDLQRAEVTSRRARFCLQGTAPWLSIPQAETPTTLAQARLNLSPGDVWAIVELHQNDEGASVAAAIRLGLAYAVSDGSFKQSRGTSAFLLEGATGHTNRILGLNDIPGAASEQSAYRSELGGISGVLATVDCLCSLYNIRSGAIRCGLDGDQAMKHASGTEPLDPQQASFDLLVDIRAKIRRSPITWKFFWIEGHQKERHGQSDAWGDLNEVCDASAKIYWNYVSLTRERPANLRFGNEGWNVLVHSQKLARLSMDSLYDLTYGKAKSKPYWVAKESNLAPHLFTNINWTAAGKVLRNHPFGKKRWLVKHLTGFCAVGRVMKRRKEWDTDACPLCGHPDENTGHILSCPDPRAKLQWIKSVDKFMLALAKSHTDPAIITILRRRLLTTSQARRFTIPAGTPRRIKLAARNQDAIGWDQFMRGRLSMLWEDAQEKWIIANATKYKRSSARWMTNTVKTVLEMTWEMWDHRNTVLHHPDHPRKRQRIQSLNDTIQEEFDNWRPAAFLVIDHRLFRSTAKHMIEEFSQEKKEQWIESVDMARLRCSQSKSQALSSSRLFMHNWLSNS